MSVVNFGREPTVIEFAIELGSVDECRRTLETLAVTTELALRTFGKATTYGENEALRGVGQVFGALATLIARERGVEAECVTECERAPFDPGGAA